jgi:predicted RNA binding protein YcfA (HicA-like mRNA interferase family)
VSRLRKLYERALRNPGSVRFDDLDRLLRSQGFVRRQPGGGSSHVVYTRGAVVLVVPHHGAAVKPVYVRLAMEALEQQGFVESAAEAEPEPGADKADRAADKGTAESATRNGDGGENDGDGSHSS